MARRTPRSAAFRSGLAALIGGVALLATTLFIPPAAAAPVPTAFSGNPSCIELGFDGGFKLDRQPTDGTYDPTSPDVEVAGVVPAGLQVLISGVTVDTVAKRVTFDWSATAQEPGEERLPFLVQAVLVKFADGGLRYDYAPDGASTDVDLYSTKDSISHVDLCWDIPDGTTTTEDTTTTTDGTTTTTDGTTTESTEGTTTESTGGTSITTEGDPEGTQVGGVVVERELPRTGLSWPLVPLGSGLVALGLALLIYERRRTALVSS